MLMISGYHPSPGQFTALGRGVPLVTVSPSLDILCEVSLSLVRKPLREPSVLPQEELLYEWGRFGVSVEELSSGSSTLPSWTANSSKF